MFFVMFDSIGMSVHREYVITLSDFDVFSSSSSSSPDLMAAQDFKNSVGSLACRLCGAAYSMPIHSLHEPIDVFSEWLDDCEAAANPHDAAAAAPARYDDEEDDEDDDDIPESSGLARGSAMSSSSTKTGGGNAGGQRETYTDLGLNDSDDDDDDD